MALLLTGAWLGLFAASPRMAHAQTDSNQFRPLTLPKRSYWPTGFSAGLPVEPVADGPFERGVDLGTTLEYGFDLPQRLWRRGTHDVIQNPTATLSLSNHPNLASVQDPPVAKKNVIGLSVFGLINKVKIKYERTLTPKFTAGATLAGYYGLYPGVQLSPFVRYYFRPQAPKGLYLQGQVGAYWHTSIITYISNLNSSGNVVEYAGEATISNVGAGAALGYQWLLGKRNRVSVDINGGFKSYKTGLANEDNLVGLTWYTTGPGSFFNGLISFGYAF